MLLMCSDRAANVKVNTPASITGTCNCLASACRAITSRSTAMEVSGHSALWHACGSR